MFVERRGNNLLLRRCLGSDACNSALLMSKEGGSSAERAEMLATISWVFERTGERRKAIESREAALAIYRATGDPNGEMGALHALGQFALESGDLVTARSWIEKAVEMAEVMRVKAWSHRLQSTYMASRQKVYESYIDLLMQMRLQEPEKGYERIALQVSERARSLLDLLAEGRAQIRQGADPALLEKERLLLERLRDKDAAWKELRKNERTRKQAVSVANEINDLTTQLRLIEAQIRRSSPRYVALTYPEPLSATEIQQLLDEETVLLEFALGDKRSWLWTVTRDSIDSHQLPPRAQIEASARKIYESLTARQLKNDLTRSQRQAFIAEADAKFQTEAEALSRMLFGEIASKLRREWKGKRLAIVASGALEYAPFAALPLPETGPGEGAKEGENLSRPVPLIADHEIVNLPSASALAEIRRETAGRQPAAKTLAVFADPVFEPNDPRVLAVAKRKGPGKNLVASFRPPGESPAVAPSITDSALARATKSFNRAGFARLPFSREEADKIAALVPKSSLLKATDFQANRTVAASGELSRYRIIHFATHGLLNSEHPELSGLVLSLVDENGQTRDGFLRMSDIFNLRLPADVVVLSACQTALGKEIRGEGIVGLTRGFMYAGAESVVASLWQVDDLATAELMQRFYRGMLKDGLRPAAALRSAQIEMLKQKQWSSPYFWAAFVIQGEWR